MSLLTMNLQHFAATGVNPVNEIQFAINMAGRTGTVYTPVKDAEALSIAFDNTIEEWYAMDMEGFVRRLMTGKSMSITMGGKRNYGDPGNDYVAARAYENGQGANSQMQITFPNGDILLMDCVINVTAAGGNSTAVETLEWEALSDGKPTYTPAPVGP